MSGEVLLARSLLSACEKELKKHLRDVRNASLLALSGNTRYTDGMKTPRPNTPKAIPIGDGRDAVRRRPGGRSARVQVAVFEATIQLLEERGYERLSIASIAERAGTHETSLYRRWNTKEQLILEALDRRMAQEIPVPDTGTLRSDLVAVLQSLRLFLQSREGQALFQTAVATLHVPELRALRQEHWRQRCAHLQILFDRVSHVGKYRQGRLPVSFRTAQWHHVHALLCGQ